MHQHLESHLSRLADAATLARLAELAFDWSAIDGNTAAAALFKRRSPDAPAFVALLGGASSGKSTVFNTMLHRDVSRVSAHAHETLGPIAAVHTDWADRFEHLLAERLIFPDVTGVEMAEQEVTTGRAGAMHFCQHDLDDLRHVVLVDLPDVTSKQAADEGSIARTLLPWFDGLIIIVDEERWFDAAVFDETISFARNLGPDTWVIFNQTERTDELAAEDRRKLADHATSRHAKAYCISDYRPGAGYRPVSESTRRNIASWLSSTNARDRGGDIERQLQRRCADVLHVNVARAEQFEELGHAVDRHLADLTFEAKLTTDLLTDDERRLLGFGHRMVPLFGVLRDIGRRIGRLTRLQADNSEIDFDKRTDALADVLRRNLEHRFRHATDSVDRIIRDSRYVDDNNIEWFGKWTTPSFDATAWATRIRAHIDAWKTETTQQSRRGDIAALSLSMPLLVADLLFLGGAGATLTWTTAWVAGLVGGKGIARVLQRSPAFKEYQTTVRAYQTYIRESLNEQCARNMAAIPRRHLPMSDPILESIMALSTPRAR